MSDLMYFSDPKFYSSTQQVMAMASTETSFIHNNGPQIYSRPDSQNLWEGICRCDFFHSGPWEREIIMDYPDKVNAVTRILTGKRQKGQSLRRKGEVEVGMMWLLILKMEECQEPTDMGSV